MARIAEARPPAEPSSAEQRDRQERILRAAARLGAEHGLERMQMGEVAKEAGVAIATLYRYFPSKNDLFVGVLHAQIVRLRGSWNPVAHPGLPSETVAEVMVEASRAMLARPKLAQAILQANNATHHSSAGGGYTDASTDFHDMLLMAMGVEEPDAHDHRMARIMEQTWFGILISAINHVVDLSQAEDDIRLAATLLIGPQYDGRTDSSEGTPA